MGSRIPESIIDEVGSRSSIVDVVGEHVRLKRKGARYWGLCPFHGEKTPSFTVNPDRNLYHCFGCGASGNVFGFLMRHDGLSFPEAVRRLAEKAGVEIPESGEDSEVARARREKRDIYFEATELAQRYYRAVLKSGRYPEPLRYLEARGIDADTAEAFGLGYAPPDWSALIDAVGKKGITSATLEMAGLAQPRRESSGHIDRFRNRVMFPIVSLAKKVLAFSGRTLDDEERAKYVNSPETEFYTKGRELFGLHIAHRGIRAEGSAILVEGNFDVVSLHARGLNNVCAPLGTALTDRQAALLKRYTDRVILLFDGDSAGRAAAEKALSVLLAADVPEVLLVSLPDGTDPDDIVRRDGVDALRRHLDGARPMLEVCIDDAIRPAAGRADITAKRAAADEVARLLQPLRNPMLRNAYISEAARRLELDEKQFVHHVRSAPVDRPPSRFEEEPSVAAEPEAAPVRPLDALESTLVEVLAERSELLEIVYREEIHHVIPHPELAPFIERAAVDWTEQGGPSFTDAVNQLENASLRKAVTAALVADHGLSDAHPEDVFYDTTTALKIRWIKREHARVSELCRVAEADEIETLMRRLNHLNSWLRDLQPDDRRDGTPAR